MEFKRIACRGKMWLFFALLLILNIYMFYSEQVDSIKMMNESGSGVYFSDLDYKQSRYAGQFDSYIDEIEAKKDDMLTLSIFSDTSSFAYKNIIKTYNDFQSIREVTPQKVRAEAINSFMGYDKMYCIGFFGVMGLVLRFLRERKQGLWLVVHSSSNGRKRLSAIRIGILSAYSIMISLVLTVSSLIVGFGIYGGAAILAAPVQSAQVMQKFVVNLTTYQFLVYYILMYAGALLINGIVLWLMLGIFENVSIGMIFSSLVYGVELILYYNIMPSNPLAILKYFNLLAFLLPQSTFTDYTNFSLAGYLINTRELITVLIVVLGVMLSVICVYLTGNKKPVSKSLYIEVLIQNIIASIQRGANHLSLMGFEIYKFFIHGKGLIIILILGYVMVSRVDDNMFVISPEESILREFYDRYTGEIDEESEQILTGMKEQLQAKEILDGTQYDADKKAYDELEHQIEKAEYLQQYGVKGWFINSKGYNQLIGDNTLSVRIVDGVIGALAIIMMLATIHSYENESSTNYIIRCTKRGRKPLLRRKMIYSFSCSLIVSIIIFGTEIYDVIRNYPLSGLMAPVQNIDVLRSFPMAINVLLFLIIWYLSRLLIYILIAALVMLISKKCTHNARAYIMSLVLLPLGAIACGINNCYLMTALLLAAIVGTVIAVMCMEGEAATRAATRDGVFWLF